MDRQGLSRKMLANVGPELWWTRLQTLTELPGFEKVMNQELRRARIAN